MEELTKKYAGQIVGQISCFDRMIIQGSLPDFNYGEGMANYLTGRGKLIFGFSEFAMPLTEAIRERAEQVAEEAGLKIDYVRKKNFRRKIRSSRCWASGASTADWSGSSRRWSHARRTVRGVTRKAGSAH